MLSHDAHGEAGEEGEANGESQYRKEKEGNNGHNQHLYSQFRSRFEKWFRLRMFFKILQNDKEGTTHKTDTQPEG